MLGTLVSGAAVMTIEILGARLVSPVFGVGLFVWSALSAVTLAALAVGYYARGLLVDQRPRLQSLAWALIVAGQRCERTQHGFIHWEVLRTSEPGDVATDAHDPLERLQLATAEARFYAMRELLPKDVWLQ